MATVCSRCKKKSLYEQFKRKEAKDKLLAQKAAQNEEPQKDDTAVAEKKTQKKRTAKKNEEV